MTKTKAKKILDNLLKANTGVNPEFIVSKQIATALGAEIYKGHKVIVTNKVSKREAYLLAEPKENVITDVKKDKDE